MRRGNSDGSRQEEQHLGWSRDSFDNQSRSFGGGWNAHHEDQSQRHENRASSGNPSSPGRVWDTAPFRETVEEGGNSGGRRAFYNEYDHQKSSNHGQTPTIPFEKHFYKPCPTVNARSFDEVVRIRNTERITVQPGDCPAPVISFEEAFCEDPYILETVHKQRFTKPTPIQMQSWPIVLSGHDLIGVAETGSGKTLGYMLPAIIHMLNQPDLESGEGPMALVLAPTRELAIQIHEECVKFGEPCGVRSSCVYGGAKRYGQIEELRKTPHFIVATPGRLIDMMTNSFTNMRRVTYLVLDEADRMLDMGFEQQIYTIVEQIRPDRQTLLWSATWPRDVEEIARDVVQNPYKVMIGSAELRANHNIQQRFQFLDRFEDKTERLLELLKAEQDRGRFLIFCAKKATVDIVTLRLRDLGFNALSIHGDKEQGEREWVLEEFKRGSSPIMIATDVAQRGLDIKNVYCVVNYDLPEAGEDYVHRIGRSGRAGARGQSVSFFTERDSKVASSIIRVLEEAKQTVPDALHQCARTSSHRSSSRYHSYSNGGPPRTDGNATLSGGWR